MIRSTIAFGHSIKDGNQKANRQHSVIPSKSVNYASHQSPQAIKVGKVSKVRKPSNSIPAISNPSKFASHQSQQTAFGHSIKVSNQRASRIFQHGSDGERVKDVNRHVCWNGTLERSYIEMFTTLAVVWKTWVLFGRLGCRNGYTLEWFDCRNGLGVNLVNFVTIQVPL